MTPPLAGCRVVVCRAVEQRGQLDALLREQGALPVGLPLIEVVPPADGGAGLAAALAHLARFTWVLFTSANGVRAVAELLGGPAWPPSVRVGAVGRATAAAASAAGIPVTLVLPGGTGGDLAAAVGVPDQPGEVLLPQAELATPALAEALASAGWAVHAVTAYRTVRPEAAPGDLDAVAGADAVMFTSASTVDRFLEAAGRDRVPPLVVCIGPSTASRARHHGLDVAAVADAQSDDGMVDALASRWTARSSATRAAGSGSGSGRTIGTVTFPQRRMRRLRRTPALRRLVAETRIGPEDLVAPLFVREGIDEPQPIASLPGVVQHTRTSLAAEVRSLVHFGVPAVILFGIPSRKDAEGSEAWNPDGVVQVALRDLRDEFGESLVLMSDLCVDEYTDHGHCGIVGPDGRVDNDATNELYAQAALAQANAGADVVAPSGMMDGQVAAIRRALDDEHHHDVAILAYAAKYASSLYGPFRDAVDVTIAGGGNRKGYQQDWRNGREALTEIQLDLAEGADMIMVKPALAYLDIIARAREVVDVPLAAYHVSGEYAMLKAAAANGWIDGDEAAVELLTAIKRAGADFVLTYLAGEVAALLGD